MLILLENLRWMFHLHFWNLLHVFKTSGSHLTTSEVKRVEKTRILTEFSSPVLFFLQNQEISALFCFDFWSRKMPPEILKTCSKFSKCELNIHLTFPKHYDTIPFVKKKVIIKKQKSAEISWFWRKKRWRKFSQNPCLFDSFDFRSRKMTPRGPKYMQ